MVVLEWIMGSVLIAMALFIVVAVMLQSSKDKQLSGTIAGGSSDTFWGKEKTASTEKVWFKWTVIAAIVFAVAVLAAYVIQPDYTYGFDLDYWHGLSEFSDLFN